MYVEALSFYIRELLREDNQQTIVFAENSGWPLEALRKKLPDYPLNRIEFISLNPKDFDISQGKGYNEMLMINQVVAQSQCIQQVGSFFKVTGRYPIYNIVYFLRQANHHLHDKNCALYCDTKDHKLYDWLHLGWNGHSFECRLFGAKKDWYLTHMAPAYVLCNDYNGNCMESVIFSLLTTYRGAKYYHPLPQRTPLRRAGGQQRFRLHFQQAARFRERQIETIGGQCHPHTYAMV